MKNLGLEGRESSAIAERVETGLWYTEWNKVVSTPKYVESKQPSQSNLTWAQRVDGSWENIGP